MVPQADDLQNWTAHAQADLLIPPHLVKIRDTGNSDVL